MPEAVAIVGLRPALRDLKRLRPEGAKALRDAFADQARPIAERASVLAPRGEGEGKRRRLADTIKGGMRGAFLVVRAGAPYANVIHWGGTTGKGHRPGVPGSGSVHIKGTLFVERAFDEHSDDLMEAIAREYDKALRHAGFK